MIMVSSGNEQAAKKRVLTENASPHDYAVV